MRDDMQEVLITPGRSGSRYARNEELLVIRRKAVEEDETGWKQSMRPRGVHSWGDRKWDQKGDYLAPLKRYLESKVGERWDDIYSEIRKKNSPDSTVGAHIYQHLWGFVERNPTYTEDGIPCEPFVYKRWRQHYPLKEGELYIDRNGYLAKVPVSPKANEPKRIVLYEISSNTFAVQNKKGIWFLMKYNNRMKKEQRTERMVSHYVRDEEGKSTAVYVDKTYTYVSPYYTQLHVNRDDFELLPRLHPKPYSIYSNYYDRNNPDTKKQYWYLVEYKTMSKKEKKKLVIT